MRGKIGAMAALVFLGCVWAMPAYGAEGDTYVAGTYLNGINVSGQTVDRAKGVLEDPDSYSLEIVKKDGTKDVIKGKIGRASCRERV